MGKDFELIAVRPSTHARLKEKAKAQGKRIIDLASESLDSFGPLFALEPPEWKAAVFENWTAFCDLRGFNGLDSDLADSFKEGAKSLAQAIGRPELIDPVDDIDLTYHPKSLMAAFKKPNKGRSRKDVPKTVFFPFSPAPAKSRRKKK